MSRSFKKPKHPRRYNGGDFKVQLRETLNEGIFYESCDEAIENWDEDWVVCPVCMGEVIEKENDDITIKSVEHREISDTKH